MGPGCVLTSRSPAVVRDSEPRRHPVGTSIERCAFAKVNLDLRVLGVRADGYHELATVFQTISLHDTIRIVATPPEQPLQITCSDPSVPTDERNLAWRAAARVWRALGGEGGPRGITIALEKGIPAQGGLGGGSADAAVVLAALAAWWGGEAGASMPGALAASLGADVPFFLMGGTARGFGRGDALEPWPDMPAGELVLLMPDFGVSTPEAFRWFDALGASSGSGFPAPAPDGWAAWLASCANDLQPPVAAHHPVIAQLVADLVEAGARRALMTGSGSTVFGLFEEEAAADEAALLWAGRAGVTVTRGRTIGRREYVRRALGGAEAVGGASLPPASAIV